MEETRQKILEIIAQKTGKSVRLADSFAHLQIDSLAMAEIAYEIEQALGIRADEGVLECQTVEEFVEYASSMVERRS